MHTVLDQHPVIQQYHYEHIFTDRDRDEVIHTVRGIIASGNYFDEQHSPKYQTKENIFGRQGAAFLKLRMTFITSCFLYLSKEVKIKGINAWSFMTKAQDQLDRERLWHHHLPDNQQKKLSGIMYLHIPKDEHWDTSGTEYTFNYTTDRDTFFLRPQYRTWYIYPSEIYHRPGITSSKEDRFVVAADMEFIL